VSAGPPERSEEPIFFLFPDPDNRLAVFVNITRENFCAWAAGGFDGAPPVETLVPVQFKETGQGAIVASFHAEAPVELWQLDADVPPFLGPCEDTDDQDAPWATGTARFGLTDNDVDVSLTRTNSFGGRTQATVTDADGRVWRYSCSGRFHITKDDEFIVRAEHCNLTPVGR
jgi:hypothetical protein